MQKTSRNHPREIFPIFPKLMLIVFVGFGEWLPRWRSITRIRGREKKYLFMAMLFHLFEDSFFLVSLLIYDIFGITVNARFFSDINVNVRFFFLVSLFIYDFFLVSLLMYDFFWYCQCNFFSGIVNVRFYSGIIVNVSVVITVTSLS